MQTMLFYNSAVNFLSPRRDFHKHPTFCIFVCGTPAIMNVINIFVLMLTNRIAYPIPNSSRET